jgi:hypothetical protein
MTIEKDGEKIPLTMSFIWDELTPDEKQGICRLCGDTSQGVMALTSIAKVMKSIYYRYGNAWGDPVQAGVSTAQMPNHTHGVNPNPYHQAGTLTGAVPPIQTVKAYKEAMKDIFKGKK